MTCPSCLSGGFTQSYKFGMCHRCDGTENNEPPTQEEIYKHNTKWIKEILTKYNNDTGTCMSMQFRSEDWIRGYKAHADMTKLFAELKLKSIKDD